MEPLSIYPPPPMIMAAGMSSPERSMNACNTHFGDETGDGRMWSRSAFLYAML